jgi:hypothetical protein
MAMMGEKLGGDLRIGQPVYWDVVGSPLSREQWDPSKSIGSTQNIAIHGLCEIRMVEGHTWTERGKHVVC